MSIDAAARYVAKAEYTAQKSRLTRAINSDNPVAVLTAVEVTLDEWSGKAWPDAWHRWNIALHDAYTQYRQMGVTKPETLDRFRAAMGRMA
jgi:hypothetical protein